MNSTFFTFILIFFTSSLVSQQHTNGDAAIRPNIVLIMADDLSMTDTGPYGSKQVHTPIMNRLAKEGLCLDNMFNVIPICAPTRQSLLTGLGPVRNGSKDVFGDMRFDGKSFKKVLTGEVTIMRDYVYGVNTTRGIINGSEAYASRSARDTQFLYIHNLNYQNKYQNVVTRSPLFQQWIRICKLRSG